VAISKRTKRIVVWTVGLASAGAFLCSKGVDSSRFLTVAVGGLVGGLIGFGFGITFARPRNEVERKLRVLYSISTFGIIGTIVGMADPGVGPAVAGALMGIVAGSLLGILLFLTDRSPSDGTGPGSVPTNSS